MTLPANTTKLRSSAPTKGPLDTQQLEKSRLGLVLLNRDYICQSELDSALKLQRENGQRLGEILIGMGAISEKQLKRALGQQKRYRTFAAAVVAVMTPIQPLVAMASGVGIVAPEPQRKTSATFSLPGLKPLNNAEMSGVAAKGLNEDFGRIHSAGAQLKAASSAMSGKTSHSHRYPNDTSNVQSSDDKQAQLDNMSMLMHLAIPVSEFLQADTKIEGVKYSKNNGLALDASGKLKINLPTHVNRISIENIRPKGTNGPAFGSIYVSDLNMKMDVSISIR